jgi:hypothetical protein
MIYRVRTIKLKAEKAAAAREVVVRAATYATNQFPGIQVEILENIAGPLHQLHMVTRCDSLAALEDYERHRQTDAGWQAFVAEHQALGAALDSVDHLYRTVG